MAADVGTYALIVITLVILEAVLSFDNAAMLAVMSRRLPVGRGRSRALSYGLLIAYGLRILAILGAAFLIQNPYFLAIGGAYLLFLFIRHVWQTIRHRERHPNARDAPARGLFGLSPLQTVVLQIGIVDLAFALDQVVAAVAFTKDIEYGIQIVLIVTAATIGLIALRALAPVLSRLMDWLPALEHMAYIAVGFVGTLLILEDLPVVSVSPSPHIELVHITLVPDETLAKTLKIGITLALFLVPIVVKFFFGIPRGRTRQSHVTRAIEQAHDPSKKP